MYGLCMGVSVRVCVCACVCVCVSVCIQRERQRQRDRDRQTDRQNREETNVTDAGPYVCLGLDSDGHEDQCELRKQPPAG